MLKRIQRKRTKGWRMPPNTVSVCRPGKWGNPYKVGLPVQEQISLQTAVLSGVIGPDDWKSNSRLTAEQAVGLYRHSWERHPQTKPDLSELTGRNLACFCPLDQPCHADYLLEIVANTKIVANTNRII